MINPVFRYYGVTQSAYRVEIVSMDANLRQYQLVILPNLIMAEPAFAEAVSDYVRQGGCVLDYRAGAKLMKGDMDLIFLIDHNPVSVSLPLDKPYREALSQAAVDGFVEIPANSELILQSM